MSVAHSVSARGLSALLNRRRPGRIKPDTARMRAVLEYFDNPQSSFNSILVVGTNGKGSTSVMLAEILRSAGLEVGLYTSPHLFEVTERIRVGARNITDKRLTDILLDLEPYPELTYFEVLTIAAFFEFRSKNVDIAVLEAGMGGRWDATRTAASDLAGLTNVGTDHQRWLGRSRAEIAADKGAALAAAEVAIIGPGVTADIVDDLGATAARSATRLVTLERIPGAGRVRVRWSGYNPFELEVPLAGEHQIDNLHLALALAVAAADRGWCGELTPKAVQTGLSRAVWPGRCTTIKVGERPLLLDGAHNLEGSRALAGHLRTLEGRHHLLFSCLDDKPVEAMADVLRAAVADVAVFELDDERAMPVDRIARAFGSPFVAADGLKALEALPDPVVAAGSLRIAQALKE